MKIIVLTEDFKIALNGVELIEAAEHVGCAEVSAYQSSLTGHKVNGFYLARKEMPETINRILVKAIKKLSKSADQGSVKGILQKTIKELRGL